MTYSRVESALVTMQMDRSAPSDLAVEAMVSGVPVEETFPAGVRDADIGWPAAEVPGP